MGTIMGAMQIAGTQVDQSITQQVETVVATSPPLQQDSGRSNIWVHCWCSMAIAAATTSVTMKIRRATLTGAQVGEEVAVAFTAGTQSQGQLECWANDTGDGLSGLVYVATVLDVAAGGAWIVNSAVIMLFCL